MTKNSLLEPFVWDVAELQPAEVEVLDECLRHWEEELEPIAAAVDECEQLSETDYEVRINALS
jgi:uncharacterized protein Usg